MASFFTRKKIIYTVLVVVLLVIVFLVFRKSSSAPSLQTEQIQAQDLKRTILATGQVTSTVNLGLSFKTSGVVQKIYANVGSRVKSGDIIATLSQRNEQASLTQARGSLASAQANLQRVLDGASSEDVQVSQAAVDSARVALKNAQKAFEDVQKQQATLVKNTYAALISSGLAAVPKTSPSSNLGSATVTVSGTYTSTESGSYVVTITSSGGSPQFTVSGLEKAGGTITAGVPVALGSRGLFVTFSSSSAYIDDTWTIDVPNMRSSSYITNLNAYNAALDSERSATTTAQNAVSAAQSALDQALATLQLKKAAARPADVAAAQAQVLSAQGQVEAASANLENTIIRAPADGTITKVDVKVGEQATALKSVVGLQDVANLYVEANVSEANIAQIKTGQSVGYTFDALGSDRNFTGRVTAIDPASTVISGVVNYKVTASVDQVSDVKPGMTANMSVLVGTSLHALAVPQRALLEKNGKTYVRVVTDTKKQAYSEVEVGTGLEADGGLVEIVRGLSAGQTIVTFVEEKK